MSRDGSTHIYGVPIYTVYILYIPYFIFPDIRACVYLWFLQGEHGEHGVLREPSRHPVVTTLRI